MNRTGFFGALAKAAMAVPFVGVAASALSGPTATAVEEESPFADCAFAQYGGGWAVQYTDAAGVPLRTGPLTPSMLRALEDVSEAVSVHLYDAAGVIRETINVSAGIYR